MDNNRAAEEASPLLMPSECVEELELITAVFDDIVVTSGYPTELSYELMVPLPHKFSVRITIPDYGYPNMRRPAVKVIDAKNEVVGSELQQQLDAAMDEEVQPCGAPLLTQIIQLARDVAEKVGDEAIRRKELKDQLVQVELDLLTRDAEIRFASGIDILAGVPIVDRKSKFLAHLARVRSIAEVENVVRELRSHRGIACAAHPGIYAYRFRDPVTNVLHQDADDDGETGASRKMLFLLDQMAVDGYVVVVTRWFGGILLGPDRFKHIMTVTKDVLLHYNAAPSVEQ